MQVDVTVEMDLNLIKTSRDIYTFLDWVSDIGGIQGMLLGLIAFFLSVCWNHNSFDNYMATRLYKMEKPDTDKKVHSSYEDRSVFMRPGIISNQRDAICDRLPGFL